MSMDDAKARLVGIIPDLQAAIASGGSEQDARLKIINRILTEVAEWPFDQIETERHNAEGFADYGLIDRQKRCVGVVEAKKLGVLKIDTTSTHKTEAKINGPMLKPATDGINQAMSYCAEFGTSYAVVTDGNVWIFFRATRTDGIRPREGKAIVFPCFDAVVEEFATFYELLAQPALSDRLHFARLAAAAGVQARVNETRYFVRDPSAARLMTQNDLARDITAVFNRFFAGISDDEDPEMRRSCFVETRESRDADLNLTKIAENLTNNIAKLETSQGALLQEEIEAVIESKRSEICLIVGNKGAGKSTFIERFFADVLPPNLRRVCVTATVDLLNYTGDKITLQRWLAEQMRDQLEDSIFSEQRAVFEDYQGMFFRVYQRWSEGTHRSLYESDKEKFKQQFGAYVEQRREVAPDDYLKGLMQHIVAGRRRLPCLIFDNTDQLPMELQHDVFQFALGLRNASLSFILVPITDRSIWRMSKAGPLQSEVSRSFYLPAPLAKEVLAKRIIYMQNKLNGDEGQVGRYLATKGIRIKVPDLNAFTNILEDAFVHNDSLSGTIGRLANYNMRRMLVLAQNTITSPTFGVEDLIRIYLTAEKRPVDVRRARRAMILGKYDRYNPEASEFFFNLFATDGNRPTSPLLAPLILQHLSTVYIAAQGDVDRTYVQFSDLIAIFEPCGADAEDLWKVVSEMRTFGLIEAFDPNDETRSDGQRFGITYSGQEHLDSTLNNPVYIEQMALATGLRYSATKDDIQQLNSERSNNSQKRLRALFREYLVYENAGKLTLPEAPLYAPLRAYILDFSSRQ